MYFISLGCIVSSLLMGYERSCTRVRVNQLYHVTREYTCGIWYSDCRVSMATTVFEKLSYLSNDACCLWSRICLCGEFIFLLNSCYFIQDCINSEIDRGYCGHIRALTVCSCTSFGTGSGGGASGTRVQLGALRG